MAKEQQNVLGVLAALEEAFSGAKEYDEVLMDLDLHTAKVRKDYPNLFRALQGKQPAKSAAPAAEPQSQPRNRATAHLQESVPQDVQPAQYQEALSETDSDVPVPTYDEWVQNYAQSSRVNDEHLINWLPNVPMPNIGEPLTIPTPTGRIRFQIIAKDESTTRIRLKMITILPRN